MGALKASTRILAFVKIAILARLLSPAQFGVFGIASLALVFMEMLTETGVNVFLIQEDKKIKEYVSTTWVVSILRGVIISAVLLAGAQLISSFFGSPESKRLLILISFVPLLRGFINPAEVVFQKNLEFNKEFFFRLSIFSIDAAVAIILTLITRSAESLVWGLAAGVILEVVLSFAFIKPRPSLLFDIGKVKRVIGRGKWVTMAGIFNYLFHNADSIVLGKLMNTYSLGLYQMAYKIALVPVTDIADIFGRVSFPVLVRIANDRARLKRAFVKVILGVSALSIPYGLILLLFAKEITIILLGSGWLAIVPILKILAVFAVVRAISGSSSALFLAIRKQEYVSAITFVSILGLGITIFPLVSRFGIIGAGLSALIGSIIALPVISYYVYGIFQKK